MSTAAMAKQAMKRALVQVHPGALDVYECPVCGTIGRFRPHQGRRTAKCQGCGALERHRLQHCVLADLFKSFRPEGKRAIHFAPDAMLKLFRARFAEVVTADLFRDDVDLKLDLRHLDLPDASFDFVFASHVLEHIDDDRQALREIYRVLKPGGVAVLPVPVNAESTIEYPQPCEAEFLHVRAPGVDYHDRYREIFDEVTLFSSADFPERYQLYTRFDSPQAPHPDSPNSKPLTGTRLSEYVPVCRKAG